MKIYLCGAINGCTDEQAKDWREYAKSKLVHETLDPMRRDFRGREDESVHEIVHGDIDDIDNSRAMLVNAARPSWGTAMEVFYASSSGLVVASVVSEGASVSPWLRYFSTRIFTKLDDAIDYLNGLA